MKLSKNHKKVQELRRTSDKTIKFEEGWGIIMKTGIIPFFQKIDSGLVSLNDEQYFTAMNFASLYTLIFQMCIQREPNDFSALIHQNYVNAIVNHLSTVVVPSLIASRCTHGLSFLRDFVTRWNNHVYAIKGLSRVFMYLDRFYTPSNESNCNVSTRGYLLFHTHVFEKFVADITAILLDCIKRERDGEEQGTRIQSTFEKEKMHSLYISRFQDHFISQTRSYYLSKQRNWIADETCPNYFKKAEVAIQSEEDRLLHYLHPITSEPLLFEVTSQLIATVKNDLLNKTTGPEYLLQNDAEEDLTRIFKLLSRVENGLDTFSNAFSYHIKKLGTSIVEEAQMQENASSHHFITLLVSLFVKYQGYIRRLLRVLFTIDFIRCFGSSLILQKALRSAFEDFINKDNFTCRHLAKYINEILKSQSNVNIQDLESTFDNIVLLYSYIREKDTFERDYQLFLATRLISNTSVSETAEKSMIVKLKSECGYQWTSRLEGMFKDIQSSKDLMRDYSRFILSYSMKPSVDLNVNVCTTGYWPTSKIVPCNMPNELRSPCSIFTSFYLKFDQGSAEMSVSFSPTVTKLYQMCVLLLFNTHKTISFGEILELTGIPAVDLITHLLPMAHPQLKILLKTPNIKNVENNHLFQLNPHFNNKLLKIKVPIMKSQAQSMITEEKEHEIIEQQRSNQIDACIVRIMKFRKTLEHNQLCTEVIKELTPRFVPQVISIKERITHLIDKEYLERDSKNRKSVSDSE